MTVEDIQEIYELLLDSGMNPEAMSAEEAIREYEKIRAEFSDGKVRDTREGFPHELANETDGEVLDYFNTFDPEDHLTAALSLGTAGAAGRAGAVGKAGSGLMSFIKKLWPRIKTDFKTALDSAEKGGVTRASLQTRKKLGELLPDQRELYPGTTSAGNVYKPGKEIPFVPARAVGGAEAKVGRDVTGLRKGAQERFNRAKATQDTGRALMVSTPVAGLTAAAILNAEEDDPVTIEKQTVTAAPEVVDELVEQTFEDDGMSMEQLDTGMSYGDPADINALAMLRPSIKKQGDVFHDEFMERYGTNKVDQADAENLLRPRRRRRRFVAGRAKGFR